MTPAVRMSKRAQSTKETALGWHSYTLLVNQTCTNFSDSGCSAAELRVWNYLLTDLRQPHLSYSQLFRHSLKTFLFLLCDQKAVWTSVQLHFRSHLTYLLTHFHTYEKRLCCLRRRLVCCTGSRVDVDSCWETSRASCIDWQLTENPLRCWRCDRDRWAAPGTAECCRKMTDLFLIDWLIDWLSRALNVVVWRGHLFPKRHRHLLNSRKPTWCTWHTQHQASFQGGIRANAFSIVNVFKNALRTALQTIFCQNALHCRILHTQSPIFSGVISPDPRRSAPVAWTQTPISVWLVSVLIDPIWQNNQWRTVTVNCNDRISSASPDRRHITMSLWSVRGTFYKQKKRGTFFDVARMQ